MKKISFFIMVALLAGACKKDGAGNNSQLLLNKIYFNDLLYKEFIYATDGSLIRYNNFSVASGQSKLASYSTYDYNADGTIKEEYRYSKDHNALNKLVYTYNAQGKVSRIDEAVDHTGGGDFEELDFNYVYEYNNNGLMTKVTCRESDFTLKWYESFAYDDKGNLVINEFYVLEDDDIVLKQKQEIDPGDKKIPAHWQKYLLQPTDFTFYDMYSSGKKYTSYYLLPGTTTTYTYKNRVYNSEGYLTSQTSEYTPPSGTLNNEYTYEYVQQ
jgi:hypothetical protein